jgi:hypothetical protein
MKFSFWQEIYNVDVPDEHEDNIFKSVISASFKIMYMQVESIIQT